MKKPTTPFPTSGYFGPAYFCNRQEETRQLVNNLNSGISTTLVSIRRMGKTGLIMHTREQLPKEWKMIYLDILATENQRDLLNALATAVIGALPEQDSFGKKAWKLVKSLRPSFSFDAFSGLPQVTFNVQPSEAQQHVQEIFMLLEKYPNRLVIAIDEFQQITNYPNKNTDAWLRSIIQHLKNVVFIYAGSQQHLMHELFSKPSRPFYRSTQLMKLDRIATSTYTDFIQKHFKKGHKNISRDVCAEILDWTRRHTYYVQLLLSRIYIRQEKKITSQIWQEEAQKLLDEQQPLFFNYRYLLTKSQWNLLCAIAAEGHTKKPTAHAFLQKHHLGTSASVLRSLAALQKKELVFSDFDTSGDQFYQVYDLLFERWIQKNQLI